MRLFRGKLRGKCPRLAALFCFLLTNLGIPLPGVSAPKDSNNPFPCQNHPCGCRTAEQCWRKCCCFTAEQRWAWAAENQVQPPSYAEKPGGRGWNNARKRDLDHRKSCCSSSRQPAQTCRHGSPSSPDKGKKSQPSPDKARPGWGLGVAAPGCQGILSVWMHATSVAPPLPLTWIPGLAPLDWLAVSDVPARAFPALPSVPPPRVF